MEVASEMCVYTNSNFLVENLEAKPVEKNDDPVEKK